MTIQEILEAHKPSRWRSFTNENEILRCCGKDFGNATKKAKRGDAHLAWTEFSAHVAQVLEQHEREREAAALEEAADEIERLENIGDTAQDELNEEQTAEYWLYHGTPKTTWLRDLAAQIRSQS